MGRKIAAIAVTATLALCLAGCGEKETADAPKQSGSGVDQQEPAPAPEPLDLTGTWEQVNKNSEDNYQIAVIEGDAITVNWVSPDSESLYWAGSYEAPTSPTDSYTWDSANDTSKTASALLASSDETKTFTYADGELSYQVTALGTTTTVRMEKTE